MTEISFYEKIGAHIRYWIDFFQMISNLKKTFQNSFIVLKKIFKNDFPINAVLKNGKKIQLESFSSMYLISNIPKNIHVDYNIKEENVTLYEKNDLKIDKIIINGGLNNGDIVNTFFKKDYAKISVKNKTVLDIGANIGDTALFYVLNGAKKVIGIEPFPKNFNYAQKNINKNKLNEFIEIIQAGCSSKNKIIKIDPKFHSDIESKIKEFGNGIDISMLTLKDIINKFKIPKDSILKIDCEGCEYDIIENVSIETISYFTNIQIEYHFGYKKLKKKLEKFGYTVNFTKPHATNVILSLYNVIKLKNHGLEKDEVEQKIGYTGFIYAHK